MSYSCVDAWDSVMDALKVEIPESAWDSPSDQADIVLAEIARRDKCHAALVEALEALFRECVMTHKHWGEGCNQRESDAAQASARAALTLAKGA